MTTRFHVSVHSFTMAMDLAGGRTPAAFAALLGLMEYGGTAGMSPAELQEMCLLSLQEREPEAAAEVVLSYDLGQDLRQGQITQLAHAMSEEKPWEEYPDMARHKQLFHAAGLLHAAFPRVFPEPDAVEVRLEVEAENAEARAVLAKPLSPSLVVRLLADGMPEEALLNRLFGEQRTRGPFPEAASIAWSVACESKTPSGVTLRVLSSGYWLDALRETRSYTSTAWPDEGSPDS